MSKLTNLKGRINYISSSAKQENLYAVYETIDRELWKELAKHNQKEFLKSGTEGKCIEARELIIALPEGFVDYQPNKLLKLFTQYFKQNYGTECIAALHHNKHKTNYHIHLIFSERKLLDEPIKKVATRNMFYDEKGKHVRTKKEILNEKGEIRKGCKVIAKGEVYERTIFTKKDSRFKSEQFLEEVKQSYTELINICIKEDKEKLQVFNKNGVYLSMKKIGKNNPKAEQIENNNKIRKNWNETVDRALVSGVPKQKIMEVKENEISQKAKNSIQQFGREPLLLNNFIATAITALELLINLILKIKIENKAREGYGINVDKKIEMPVKSIRASKFQKLSEIYQRLEKENELIYQREEQITSLEKDLGNIKGIFKGNKRKELKMQIEQLQIQVKNLKQHLSESIQAYGYKNMKEFMNEYAEAKKEYVEYKVAVSNWEKQTGNKMMLDNVKGKMEYYKQQSKKQEKVKHNYYQKNDRNSR